MPTPLFRTRANAPSAGFGLIQALVLLLMVASALGAGLMLLQSRRVADQTRTQEDTLRWAEEAVTSFASANSRLPCPAATLNGPEDCGTGRAAGWLPLDTLAGASGSAPGVGPVRYAVYRGDAAAHLDLTAPLNAYSPVDLAGEPRKYTEDVTDAGGNTSSQEFTFDSVNGLDFCHALGLAGASASAADTALAGTTDSNALPVNIAYGLAAAGPDTGAAARLDGSNAGAGAQLESPWRMGDSGYDDRVRVQTFAGVAHAVGCRQIADASVNTTPDNIATASVDALAAALTLHDSVAGLQENNIGNTEAAVRDAGYAQAMSAAQVLLAAGHIADTVSSNVTAVAELIRAIGTCIASLGATCWEVPIKASAIAMEVASIISYGVALGINIGTVSMTAVALNKTIEVRERAKNSIVPDAKDVGEAAKKVCIAAHGGILDERIVVKRDADGNIIWKRDASGKQIFDENGNPEYEYETEYNVYQEGLEQQKQQAQEVHDELLAHAEKIRTERIVPFSDGQIRWRIDEGVSINMHDGRYRMSVCEAVSGGQRTYSGGACTLVYDGDGKVVPGGHDWVQRFNWTLAISDAALKRAAAERWSDSNRAASEAEEIWEQARDNYSQWTDTLLPAMESQRDKDCAKASTSTDPEEREQFAQVCENDRAAVNYTRTCRKTESVKLPDGTWTQRETLDTDIDAPCLPQLRKKRDDAEAVKNNAASDVANKKSSYDSQPAPYFNYPAEWSYWMLVEDGETALGNPRYLWKRNNSYWMGPGPGDYATPPFYFRDQHALLETNTDMDIFGCIFGINPWVNGTLCERYPYSRAYNDYRTAKIAADEAKKNYDQLETQYTMMASRCEALKKISDGGPNAVCQANLAIGADSILRRADELGSVGASQPRTDPATGAPLTCEP